MNIKYPVQGGFPETDETPPAYAPVAADDSPSPDDVHMLDLVSRARPSLL